MKDKINSKKPPEIFLSELEKEFLSHRGKNLFLNKEMTWEQKVFLAAGRLQTPLVPFTHLCPLWEKRFGTKISNTTMIRLFKSQILAKGVTLESLMKEAKNHR
jgi:hypothetical protein